jgi:hypothetical protein
VLARAPRLGYAREMRWSRRQVVAVLIIPMLAVLWMIYRVATRTPDLPGDAQDAVTATAPAASPSTTLPPRREADAPVTTLEVITDEAGRFQLRNLSPGAYRVTFGEPGNRGFTTIDGVAVNDVYGANLMNLRLQLAGDGTLGTDEYQPNKLPRLIRGNVVDGNGAPVVGLRVRAVRR